MIKSRLPAHEATTAQLGAAYPFVASRPLGVSRVFVGRDLAGGPFMHDPFALYASGALTNPNVAILGQIGRGKSALVKSYLYRQAAFGRQIAVLDPKGEYGGLAAALGVEPIVLSPSGGVRINPLDDAGLAGGGTADVRHRRLVLLGSLAEATLHRRLTPREHLALDLGLDHAAARCSVPTLSAVVDAVLRPDPDAGLPIGVTTEVLVTDGRDVGLELRRLVGGDLAGMFDGETTPTVATKGQERAPSLASGSTRAQHDGPRALIVDLSQVYHSEALPALMVCAAAWLQSMTGLEETQTLLVVDEAWAVLSDVAVGRFLRSSWKLARARGVANIAVCHRASDLSASGAAGSEEARLAEGLLADSETVICYAQPASELEPLAGVLGCEVSDLAFLPRLPRGVALWRVGGQSYLVEHLLARHESVMVDTDARFRQSITA
ncbi:MAG: ATP-binding protein [Actinomycetota bacterium]|nr:ATP-binding protein [Actinomycetota bacterium]